MPAKEQNKKIDSNTNSKPPKILITSKPDSPYNVSKKEFYDNNGNKMDTDYARLVLSSWGATRDKYTNTWEIKIAKMLAEYFEGLNELQRA